MTDTADGTGSDPNDNERVYASLRRGIIEGRYAPASRLVEQRLAEEFSCSRTPVREAVRRLESEGLVVVARNRGAQVRPLTEGEIADLYGVRARLEAYGAELAAHRHVPGDVPALEAATCMFDELSHQQRGPADLGTARALEAANAAFHTRLLLMSRHGRIATLVAAAVDAPLVFHALHQFEPTELSRSAQFHRLIAEAVIAREADRAGRLMTEHVLQGRDTLLQLLSDAGGVADLFARETA